MKTLKNKNLLLCVTGSIAAYKACELLRLLRKEEANVQVMMSKSAEEFVGKLSKRRSTGKCLFSKISLFSPSIDSLPLECWCPSSAKFAL